MRAVWFWLCVLCACATSPVLAQQVCNPALPATAPDARFVDHGDGSVTDTSTGLIWSRCSLGQEWVNGACQGEAMPLLWSVAALLATDGWRLPEIKELSGIVELQCARPAINTSVFPTTPPAAYWSRTRFVNRDGSFWQVQFILGESLPERGDRSAYARLVRDPH